MSASVPDSFSGIDMDDPDFPSGTWKGFYLQYGRKHRQEIALTFRDGNISGVGSDPLDHFSIRGSYDRETKKVWWNKSYQSPHQASVAYDGCLDGSSIWGMWNIHGQLREGFRLWRPGTDGEVITLAIELEQPAPGVLEPCLAQGT